MDGKFLEYPKNTDTEFKYKVLVYPNITYAKDLEKDSFIVVLKNIIEYMRTTQHSIHWTVLVPYKTECLNTLKDNVDQIIYELPTYPNTMRTHFNSNAFEAVVKWQTQDFDFIYSHLPEHSLQISNILHNTTDLNIPIYGYCHWYEINENTSYSKRMFLANIAGTLEMNECGVNSMWLKDLILKKASEYFNDEVIEKLNTIIQPHYLGIDSINENFKNDTPIKLIPKSIIFNHRPNEYTGFDWFVETLDELYKERQDFKLYLTLTDLDRPYAERVNFVTRKDYIEFLQKMYVGVGAFEKYSAWSIATTDSLSQGVPYLLPDKLCYPEMLDVKLLNPELNDPLYPRYPLFYKDRTDFKNKLNNILSNPIDRKLASNWLRENVDSFLWGPRIAKWFNNWNFLDNMPVLREETESYKKIVSFIKKKKETTKEQILEHMGWGVRIGFSNYRNLLRLNPHIKFTKYKYIYKN
jgi:glycosyltransferase involved in cell wall biosynthesis